MKTRYQLKPPRGSADYVTTEEAARLSGMHPEVVESFMRACIIPLEISKNGVHRFDQRGIERLRQIQKLRRNRRPVDRYIKLIFSLSDELAETSREPESLRDCLNNNSPRNPGEHKLKHRGLNHRNGMFTTNLIITDEAAVAGQPSKGSFNDPALWQNLEFPEVIATVNDFRCYTAIPRKRRDLVKDDSIRVDFGVTLRIDAPAEFEYYVHGGILQMVLRQKLKN